MRSLAIVPAYNEEATVGAVVRELGEHAPDFDVLVVDDGSTDATSRAAAASGAKVVRHPFNLGIGGAMQSGYLHAAEQGYDLAVQIDADGQHDPRAIATLRAELARRPELDMVTGSRFLRSDEGGDVSSRTRRSGIAVFSRLLSRIVGAQVTDPTSGLRMTTRRGIELFARDYPHDYPEVEAILMIHAHRLQSAEVPVRMRARAGGRSSINASRSVYYMVKVLLAVVVGLFRARPNVQPGDRAPVVAEHGF